MILATLLATLLSLPSPAGSGAAEPHLAARADGTVVMSWLEQGVLKFASLKNGRWSSPRTIVEGKELFVNWADFPSIVDDGRGVLFAHWLQKSGKGTYAYDVWVTSSSDDGKTWRKPLLVNRDGKQAEHGFVSFGALPAGGVALVWLDGREMKEEGHGGHGGGHEGSMTLRYAEIDAALKVRNESVLDARVCECCGTAMAITSRGPLVAYRDRSGDEVRDIAYTRRTDGKWSNPARVRVDNWKIPGCPVNGPQVDARGERAALAWFTGANEKPQVQVAFSRDAGATFGRAVRVDRGNAAGRVDVLLLNDGSALVTWIEGAADNAGIFARRVSPDGKLDEPVKLAATSSARASGFPRAALAGTTAYFAWTDPAAKTVKVQSLSTR
ncbi:MAG TPA: sialidase family protein [Thermoanaerobaculia bacterium]|nr:sialidase family protein [Thermoanaerobaculia bacterium]